MVRIFRGIVEWSGIIKIACEQSGYVAEINYKSKPLFVGTINRIEGTIYKKSEKKTLIEFNGHWNGVVKFKNLKEKKEFEINFGNEKLWKPVIVDHNQFTDRSSESVWKKFKKKQCKREI